MSEVPTPESSARPAVWAAVAGVGVLLLGAAALRLGVGSFALGLPDDAEGARAVLGLRAERLLVGALVGAALAIAGVALQTLLRNPLAEPFLLGLSTAAALGMVVQWWVVDALGMVTGAGYAGALVGALVCTAVVFLAGRRGGVLDPLALLLTGVVIGTLNGAAIMLLVKLKPGLLRDDLANWMMGFLRVGGDPWPFRVTCAAVVVALALLLTRTRALDILTLPPSQAEALGVAVGPLRALLFVVSGVLAAGAVVLAGPVAFVGLIAPHLARVGFGVSHGRLLPAAAALGAALVVLADTAGAASALVFGVGVIPLGVFTALIGGVSFLWLLRGAERS